jgi:hypothetical protein
MAAYTRRGRLRLYLNYEMSKATTQAQISIRARYFYLGCVLLLAIRFVSSTLFSQLSQPVLIYPGIDNTYWLFHWLGIPHMATHSVVWSAVLDILLFIIPIVASILPERRVYAVLFTLLLFVYQLTYSTYAIHHYHSLIGMLFLSIPFWFGSGERFTLMWQAVRYYFFFIFTSAALWKLSTGSLFAGHQMRAILMAQHAQYIFDYPGAWSSHFYSYLIAHSALSQAFLWAGFLLQASFIGGFFTAKYDRIYLILFIAFFVMNYVLMHILSPEFFIFCLVLADWDKMSVPAVNRT